MSDAVDPGGAVPHASDGARALVLKTVVPAVGTVVCFFLYLAPARAVLAARRRGCLGDLNPIPMVSMLANAIGWTIYGVATSDLFIYLSNIVGILLATPFVFSVFGFASEAARNRITGLAFFYAALMSVAGGVAAFATALTPAGIEILWGAVTNVQLLAFYAAPLSTIGGVLKARNAASIAANWPMTAVSAANAALWAAYGFAIGRPFVWAPNVAGLVLGAVQLGLCLIFPAHGGGAGKAAGGAAGGGGGKGGAAPRLVTVSLAVTPAGRADAGGAPPAGASRRRTHSISASMQRTLSFGQWGVDASPGQDADDGPTGWGAAFRAAGRRLSASLLPGGSSRGAGGGGSSRGLLGGSSSRGARSGGAGAGGGDGAWRAWFSAGAEPSGGGGSGSGASAAPARAATAGDEESGSAAVASSAAVRPPPPARTRTFGQFK